MENRAPQGEVVFVHLGPELPSHIDDAIAQARTVAPRVSLILDRPADHDRRFAGTQLIDAEELVPAAERTSFARASGLDGDFRGGFWHLTSLRLLAVGRYASRRPWPVVHLENDVLLYLPPSELVEATNEKDLWMPILSASHVSAGIVLVRHSIGGSILADTIEASVSDSQLASLSEMQVLAHLVAERSDVVGLLPRVPATAAFDPALRCLPLAPSLVDLLRGDIRLDWCFDAGGYGQYLGGIDPRNGWDAANAPPKGFRAPVGYVSRFELIDTSQLEFGLLETQGVIGPGLACDGAVVKLANLHVHSKKLAPFTTQAARSAWTSELAVPRQLVTGEEVAWMSCREEWSPTGGAIAHFADEAIRRGYRTLMRVAAGPVGNSLGLRRRR